MSLPFCFIVFPSFKRVCGHCKYISPSSCGTILSCVAVQSWKCHLNVRVYLCPSQSAPSLTLPASSALSIKEAIFNWRGAGVGAISHHLTDSSIWYTDSICGALQATFVDNTHTHTHRCPCTSTYVPFVSVRVGTCACVLPPSCLSELFLFSPGPISSSISCRPCPRPRAPRN